MIEERQSSHGGNGISGRASELARRLSVGEPARRVVGLPIARFIPQDVHSVADYLSGATTAALSAIADETAAKIACATLGTAAIGMSLFTDYRLSLARWIPIEVHEMLDHALGMVNIAAPFVFGYRRRDPLVSAIQMATGAAVIVTSLFTDYRAFRRPMRRGR